MDGTLTIPNDKAAGLAADKKTLPISQQKEMWIDLGIWQGYLSNVKAISIDSERKPSDENYDRPLTSEERANAKQMMARVRANLEAQGKLKPSFSGDISKDY